MTSIEPESFRGFFAVAPAVEIRAALKETVSVLQSESWANQVRWSPAENFHLTIRFMGTRTDNDFQHWIENMRPVLANIEPFEVCIDKIELFPNRHRPVALAALVQSSESLIDLVGQVEAVVQSRALPERHDYRGHFTLGRCKRGFARTLEITHAPINLTLPVMAVDLYRSDIQPDGVCYTRMAHLPLGGLA